MAPSPARFQARPHDSRGQTRPLFPAQDAPNSYDTQDGARSAPGALLERLEAVDREAARRKFAFYGRQNAHVDQIRDEEDGEEEGVTLQSALLLVENGELVTRLDDVSYLLDGLLEPGGTQRGTAAQAKAVLDLTRLLQDEQVQQAVALGQRRIQSRIGEVLRTRLGEEDGDGVEIYRLSLAVLAYFMSLSGDGDEYFNEKALDALVRALKRENSCEEKSEKVERDAGAEKNDGLQQLVRLRKMCLKRKQTKVASCKAQLDCAVTGTGDSRDSFALEGNRSPEPETVTDYSSVANTTMTDELWRMQLDKLLCGHETFFVEGKLQVSTSEMLWSTLFNLLKVENSSLRSLSVESVVQCYQQRRQSSSGNSEGDAFRRICARKRQLVRNGGVNILVHGLANQLNTLKVILPSSLAKPVSFKCARSLLHANALLSVLDQVSFLTVDVQQYLSRQRVLFSLVLEFIMLLSDLSWGKQAQKRWESESAYLTLAVEVLVTSLRVLINLTHHNVEAARHMYALGGMRLLANAFSHLRNLMGTLSALEKGSQIPLVFDKWEFDACLLLLSAMVNSVEFSDINRDALATVAVSLRVAYKHDAVGIQTERTEIRACELLTQFFLVKVKSYVHLIDSQESRGTYESVSIEEENDDWNPEDVILGGCASLLLGYLMKGSSTNSTSILKYFPDSSSRLLLRALGVFVAFHSQIGALTPEVIKSVLRIETVFKSFLRDDANIEHSDVLMSVAADRPLESRSPVAQMEHKQNHVSTIGGVRSMSIAESNGDKGKKSPRFVASTHTQPLRDVCSNIDESDSEKHRSPKHNSQEKKLGGSLQTHMVPGMSTPVRSSLRSPVRRRTPEKSAINTPSSSRKSPRRGKRASLTAVQPDGTLASPVVARLLKRTRQLVDEFDAEFACRSGSVVDRDTGVERRETGTNDSPCVVLTMDVTCRHNGSDGLDLSQDGIAEDDNTIPEKKYNTNSDTLEHLTLKRRRKIQHRTKIDTQDAVSQLSLFEFPAEDTPPSTPLRQPKSSPLLQTPTRTGCSAAVTDRTLSANLTPKTKPPTTPLRTKGSSVVLRTPTKNGRSPITSQSPMSASPHRRRTKVVRTLPSARASSVFDFMD